MATLTPRGQRGITLIEIVLWCAIVAAAVVAVFVFGKKAAVTAAVETEQRQVQDVVKTVEGLFATQPNFAALGTNGAMYLRERAARSGLKFQTNDDGAPILTTGLGSGALTLSAWDAVPPSGPAVPNSGYRLAYQGLAPSECSKLVTATYPVAYQVSAGQDGLNDSSATNLATRGQMTVSPAVIAENCAAGDGNATVFLYFYPARAIAGATTPTPPPAARCAPVHERQNVACPAGQTGTVTQERDGTCTGPGNTMVYTVWTTTNDTCQAAPTPPATVTPPTTPDDCTITTYTQVLACSAGQIGQVVQSRNHDTCADTYTPWVTTSNSCQPQPPSGTCTPATQSQTLACPAGQGGQLVQERSSTCATPTSAPTWSGWNNVSNTCTAGCLAAGTCCTVKRETQPGAACAAGTYGTAGEQERFLGCDNATTQTASWSPWQDFSGGSCTTCPATATESNTRWDARTDACPVGQTGSITYEAEQVRTRDQSYNCPAGTTTLPAPTITTWSGWADTGARRNTVTSCVPSTCAGNPTETQWVGTVGACASGESGSYTWEREQIRTRTCSSGTWGAWSGWGDTGATRNTVNTCAPTSTPAQCDWANEKRFYWKNVTTTYETGYTGPMGTLQPADFNMCRTDAASGTTTTEISAYEVWEYPDDGDPSTPDPPPYVIDQVKSTSTRECADVCLHLIELTFSSLGTGSFTVDASDFDFSGNGGLAGSTDGGLCPVSWTFNGRVNWHQCASFNSGHYQPWLYRPVGSISTRAMGTLGDRWNVGGDLIDAQNAAWAASGAPSGMIYNRPTPQGINGLGGTGYEYEATRWLPDQPVAIVNGDTVSGRAVIQISHAGETKTVTMTCTGIPFPSESRPGAPGYYSSIYGYNGCNRVLQSVIVGGVSYDLMFSALSQRSQAGSHPILGEGQVPYYFVTDQRVAIAVESSVSGAYN